MSEIIKKLAPGQFRLLKFQQSSSEANTKPTGKKTCISDVLSVTILYAPLTTTTGFRAILTG